MNEQPLPSLSSLDRTIDEQGCWSCTHVDAEGRPAPATELCVGRTTPWGPPDLVTSTPRRHLRCPDCGTTWRVWVPQKVARPSIEWPLSKSKVRRAPRLEIDQVIERVAKQVPNVRVDQEQGTHPGDDDGLWRFYLAKPGPDIQIESSTGACPFLIETSFDESSAEALKGSFIEETAALVVTFLKAAAEGRTVRLVGEKYWKESPPIRHVEPPQDWSEFDRRKAQAAWGLPITIAAGLTFVVSLGTGFYWTVPVAVALFFLAGWLHHRLQAWPCPRCGKPFALSYFPVGSDLWTLLTAEKCQACGLKR
ncbi:MAG: hypothetical protein IPL96_03750 [Holophagaceae bacterium]|nr:hypothetical protein [Holophagaceae bacterium]